MYFAFNSSMLFYTTLIMLFIFYKNDEHKVKHKTLVLTLSFFILILIKFIYYYFFSKGYINILSESKNYSEAPYGLSVAIGLCLFSLKSKNEEEINSPNIDVDKIIIGIIELFTGLLLKMLIASRLQFLISDTILEKQPEIPLLIIFIIGPIFLYTEYVSLLLILNGIFKVFQFKIEIPKINPFKEASLRNNFSRWEHELIKQVNKGLLGWLNKISDTGPSKYLWDFILILSSLVIIGIKKNFIVLTFFVWFALALDRLIQNYTEVKFRAIKLILMMVNWLYSYLILSIIALLIVMPSLSSIIRFIKYFNVFTWDNLIYLTLDKKIALFIACLLFWASFINTKGIGSRVFKIPLFKWVTISLLLILLLMFQNDSWNDFVFLTV
jgi:hypothetical protein